MPTAKQIAGNRRNDPVAYQRVSTELQKYKKARQLVEIGFASQKPLRPNNRTSKPPKTPEPAENGSAPSLKADR